jgi:two-component system LytT family response regulator
LKNTDKLRAIIIDDENKSRENLAILLNDFCQEVEVIDMAATLQESVVKIKKHSPDLLFLDIQLETYTGFDVLNVVNDVNFDVIFTTAYSDYAIQAIRWAALDYLMKPINITELKKAVQKAYSRKNDLSVQPRLKSLMQQLKSEEEGKTKITLSTSEGLKFIRVAEILYMKAEGSYTYVFLKDSKKYLVTKNLKEFETQLSHNNFFRIHHAYLINIDQVDIYIKGEGGQVVMTNGDQLDVSKRRKPLFLKTMEK